MTHPESCSDNNTGCNKTTPAERGTHQVLLRTKQNPGGRPKKDVPVRLIRRLSKQGMGIRDIVKKLKAQGQTTSAMTVSRVLSGKRE